jgi:benzoyl-CoA reductase/2-hydroxyglutaryl-CoA dehydratase subunit BcrC/BadD/HgdB
MTGPKPNPASAAEAAADHAAADQAAEASRRERLMGRLRAQDAEERRQAAKALRDGGPSELGYFLDLLEAGPGPALGRLGRPAAALLCLQAPLELIHAHGFAPFKIPAGGSAPARLAAPFLPAVMCPMLRSAVGAAALGNWDAADDGPAGAPGPGDAGGNVEAAANDGAAASSPGGAATSGSAGAAANAGVAANAGAAAGGPGFAAWILPSTCDWSVKFPAMCGLAGSPLGGPVHRLELPRQKDDARAQERWREEFHALAAFLRSASGKRIRAGDLRASMDVYLAAWRALDSLFGLRRSRRISAAAAQAVANSFFLDDPRTWTANLVAAVGAIGRRVPAPARPAVFLAGSPIFFPNLKILDLIAEAGLEVAADDLCSSERMLPGPIAFDDPSETALIKALAQRYHQGCLCPTFSDNDRRVNGILSPARRGRFSGVVYHVLKGCHPFDLESLSLEARIKGAGLRFLRLETDYGPEDSQNILTRLEAFRASLA